MNLRNSTEVIVALQQRLVPVERADTLVDVLEGQHPRARKAAVLLALFDQEDETHLVFIRRATTLRAHSGEIAFPGGAVDADDASSVMTALREAQEEIGLDPARVHVLGILPAVFTVVSNFLITPVVAFLPRGLGTLRLQASEVTELILLPLHGLADPAIMHTEQWKVEQRRQEEQFQHDQEMARLQKELELQYKAKEQDQQRQEQQAEAIRSTQLQATTIAERVQAYRQALHADPRIARLQILDMNRPLTVTDIYIRVRLHQETRPGYEDPTLLDAQMRRDPNALLKAGQLRLASRTSTALEPHEAIHTYQHCIIVGDPGAGKTTLLKYLTLQSVDHQLANLPDLPIHIELNAFASSGHRDLLEFASSVWEERYGFPKTDALAHIQDSLQHGKAILLLDALDETMAGTTKEQAEESYTHATKAITDLATRYHQSPIVVTARKAGYHQRARLGGFTELEVLDFRPEDITQFVNRWFACHPNPRKRANAA